MVLILIWLLLMSLPFFAFSLAANKQLTVGSDPRSQVRVFLLQERDAEGIGVEWTRPLPGPTPCVRTSVRYFMWAGTPENVTYCQCFDPNTGASLPVDANSCNPLAPDSPFGQ